MLDQAKPAVRWAMGHALPRGIMRMAARRGDLQGRLVAADGSQRPADLVPLFEAIRERGPVVDSRLTTISVDHATVKEVLTSNDFATGFDRDGDTAMIRMMRWAERDGLHPLQPPSLLVSEPPEHPRYRKLVTKVFTARAVEKLRDRTQQIADELLDRLPTGEPVDLIGAYCELLPVTVIAEILGVPEADRAHVLTMGASAAASLDMGLPWRRFTQVERALDEFDDWLTDHLAHLRAHPGEDLLSGLVTASADGQRLNERELKSTAGLVLAAGFETTVNLLGNGIRLLVDHPDQLAALKAEPERWSTAVDEVLRFDPPVLLTSRTALRDTEISGHPIPTNRVFVTVLAGANRDPKVFTDPNRFDVTRANARDHLSFSAGRHFCLGAALARMEGEVGLRSLLQRYDVRLLPGDTRRPTRILRGFEHLPAVLSPNR